MGPPAAPRRLRLRSLAALSPAYTPVGASPIRRPFHTKPGAQSAGEAAPVQKNATFEKQHVPSPFDSIRERRAKAGKLVAGVAAASDSDMFKAPSFGKPKAKDWNHHLTAESRARHPCTLKQAARYLRNPGLISLGGGLPSSEYFPYGEISMRVAGPPHFSEQDTLGGGEGGQMVTIGKYDVRDGTSEYDLSIALNYGQSTGSAQMMRFITEHTELVYNPPYADWHVCQTIGSTGALEQALRMLCDPRRNDAVLTEEYSFSTALETIAPLGVKAFGVRVDDQGLVPESMDELLSTWDEAARGARKPHVLYTVPSGQNPTGATQGVQRRRDIYAVCQKHDVFIIEDEPYYFLQMEPYRGRGAQAAAAPPQDIDAFLSSLIPSLLSMDVDGRVLRMDSFSKVLVPGSRLGWVTGSAQVVERYIRHAEVASQGPSGFSQVMLWKLLDETWGHEGYLRWLMELRMHYTRRRDMLLAACEEHLPREVVSWAPPAAGMFLWLRVDPAKHPDHTTRGVLEIEDEIFNHAIDNGVLCARGSWFRTEPHLPAHDMFFRATFASASEEAMSTAIQRLGDAIRKSYRLG